MHNQTIIIDLANDVFELGIVGQSGKITQRHRLRRADFAHFMRSAAPSRVVMEACGSAHHWARTFQAIGHQVSLIPPQYVAPYRRRNKTDRADVSAILSASREDEINPVRVKSVDQQNLQLCHRMREQWKQTRNARINSLRAVLREHGHVFALGANVFLKEVRLVIDEQDDLRFLLPLLNALLEEIDQCAQNMAHVEKLLKVAQANNADIDRLQTVPGIGLMTSTGLVAAVADPSTFRNGRQLANWLGITPKEHSSGDTRRMGGITHQGNTYLRMLFIHGARSVLAHARRIRSIAPESLSALQQWAAQLSDRAGFNKAAVALANKLVRIAWAVWRHQRAFEGQPAAMAEVPA